MQQFLAVPSSLCVPDQHVNLVGGCHPSPQPALLAKLQQSVESSSDADAGAHTLTLHT